MPLPIAEPSRFPVRRPHGACAAVLLVLLLVSCGVNTGNSYDADAERYYKDPNEAGLSPRQLRFYRAQSVLRASCAGSECHSASIVVWTEPEFSAFFNSAGIQLVKPGDPAGSNLWRMLKGVGTTATMPKNSGPIASADAEKLRDWITKYGQE